MKGLKPDIGYEFRVTAENKAGTGPPSAPSSPIKYEEEITFIRDLSDVKVRLIRRSDSDKIGCTWEASHSPACDVHFLRPQLRQNRCMHS